MSKNKKTSKILYSICFVFLSALSILGLVKALDDGGKIEISKKATKVYGEDNNNLEYGRKALVTLDVNALPYNESTTTNGKLDVILILDRSGSMSKGVNGENDHTKSRLDLVKEASDSFIDTIMSENNNVKLGVVDYSKDVRSHNMTTDKNKAQGYNDYLWAYDGTNIQEAIKKAQNLLNKQGRDDAKKIIILLTDGIPTYFKYNGKIYGTGENDKSVCVEKVYDECIKSMRPSEAAKNELDTFKSSYPKADVYTITFGNESEAANKLQTINPEEITKDHIYENTLSLNAEELNKKFQSITESIQNVIGKNAVVTDIIPNTFELTESSIKDLESKGVNIETNSKGEQVLTWNIGNINANNKITLEYEVIAKDEFHGNMFTNTNAVLNVDVSDNNPYYEGTKQTLTFEKPTVEIPAIANNDSYKNNSSYVTKEGETLTGTTILNNDINKQILANKNNADVDDEIIIIENENTVKKEDGSYELYKNKEFYGVLTLNSDGTFNFESIKGQTGEISFDYKIKSNIKNGSETDKVYSNISTVTLNILEIEKTTISGTKTWVDDNNRDGIRPNSITVCLYADGKEYDKKVVNKETNWSYEFKDLYTEEHNKKIVYEVREEKVEGYDSEVLENGNIINTHEVEKTSVSGIKTWVDDNNRDGKRPNNITVNLYANGSKIASKKVSIDNNWKYTFDDLYKNENGKVIEYSVIEETISGYNTSYDGFNITNTHESEKININVSKEWINKDNIYNHPDNVKVKVTGTASGNVVYKEELTLNKDNNWKQKLTNLYKYNNGIEINYVITEQSIKDYDVTYNDTLEGNNRNIIITNTYNPEVKDITITKTWVDDNNRDGLRPNNIEFELYAYCDNEIVHTYEQKMNDSWSYTFTNLPVYANGFKIKYIVDEKLVDGYTKSINGFNITNTHEIETTSISGTKTWVDDNNRDGLRPGSITINLLANNEIIKSKEVSANSNWTYEFTNLPVYENGKEIIYSVNENEVEGYTGVIDGYNITNTHEIETTSISGTKTWEDDNNRDGLRPDSINVYLYSNDKLIQTKLVSANDNWTYEFTNLPKYENGKEIRYRVDEESVNNYFKSINGFNITNTHVIETTSISGTKTWDDDNNRDGLRPDSIEVNLYGNNKLVETKEVSANSNWTYEFTNLPVKDNGKVIEYRVDENEVEGYTGVIDGYNITNKHNPITKTIKGSKLWVDQNNKDGLRPESITIKLFGNDKLIETKEVSADSNWTYEFSNLLAYENGEPINYYVREEEVDKYTTTYDGFDIINTHTPKDITVSGTKTWIDKDNRYGHPSSIKVNLQGKVGDKVVVEKQLEVKELDDWKYEFNELPEYFEGKLIDYTISEDAVKDYDTTINGFDIINTYNPETINISGQKTWEDDNNRDGIRPDSIKVNLYNNDILIETKEVSANDNWTYEFTNLPKYANGQIINYSIKETDVSGYVQELDEYNIINNHSPEKVNFNVKKVWNDDNNNDGIRPDSIRVVLYANGNYVTETTISEENDWTYEFNDLFKYENGQIIEYKIVEDEVKGYISSYETIVNNDNKTEIIITNSHENETIDLEINKIWDDKQNIYNTRPDHINVDLYENGILLDNLIITKESDWKLILNGLQKYKNGIEIEYTVIEKEVENYKSFYRGTNIYNRLNKNFEQVNNDYVYMSYQFEEIPPMTGIENKKTNIYYLLLLVTGMMFSIKKILE